MRKLNEKERTWINLMLKPEFLGKKALLDQVKHSLVEANYNKGFISLIFVIQPNIDRFPYKMRVPIEMLAKQQKGNPPVVLLIHVIDGLINELEIFNAGSLEIKEDFDVDSVEVLINSELLIR